MRWLRGPFSTPLLDGRPRRIKPELDGAMAGAAAVRIGITELGGSGFCIRSGVAECTSDVTLAADVGGRSFTSANEVTAAIPTDTPSMVALTVGCLTCADARATRERVTLVA